MLLKRFTCHPPGLRTHLEYSDVWAITSTVRPPSNSTVRLVLAEVCRCTVN